MKIVFTFLLLVLCSSCSDDRDKGSATTETLAYSDYCYLESNRDIFLIHSDAVALAQSSTCFDGRTLTGKSFCNENFGAWWLEMTTNDGGNTEYCVVDAETREVVIHPLE